MAVSAAFIFLSVVFVLQMLAEGGHVRGLLMAAMFGAVGVGTLAIKRATLPGWAMERAEQMEGLARRIPLLLKD